MAKRGLYDIYVPPFPNGDDIKLDRNFHNQIATILYQLSEMGAMLIDIINIMHNPKDGYKHRFRQKSDPNITRDHYNGNPYAIEPFKNKPYDEKYNKTDFNHLYERMWDLTGHAERLNIPIKTKVKTKYQDEVLNFMPDGKINRDLFYRIWENTKTVNDWIASNMNRYFDNDGWCVLSCQIGCQETCQLARQYTKPDENCKTKPDGIHGRLFTSSNYNIINNYNNNIYNLNKQYRDKGIPISLPYYLPVIGNFVVFNHQNVDDQIRRVNNAVKSGRDTSASYDGGAELYSIRTGNYFNDSIWKRRSLTDREIKSRNFAFVKCSNDYIVLRNFDNYTTNTHNLDYYKYIKYTQFTFYYYSGGCQGCGPCNSCSNK